MEMKSMLGNIFSAGNSISINGKTYVGNNVQVVGGRVYIDGREQTDTVSGVVEIRVLEGTIHELRTDASVSCQDVTGNVSAGGSVNCDDVGGAVSAGGSVNCGKVGGSVRAGGSICYG